MDLAAEAETDDPAVVLYDLLDKLNVLLSQEIRRRNAGLEPRIDDKVIVDFVDGTQKFVGVTDRSNLSLCTIVLQCRHVWTKG